MIEVVAFHLERSGMAFSSALAFWSFLLVAEVRTTAKMPVTLTLDLSSHFLPVTCSSICLVEAFAAVLFIVIT